MSAMLTSGDRFPAMTLSVAGGGELELPGDFEMPLNIMLFYRGHW